MSEPRRLGEVLPEVLENIRRRCEQNPHNKAFNSPKKEHTTRVLSAIGEFMHGKKQCETALPASRKKKVWSGNSESGQGIFIEGC